MGKRWRRGSIISKKPKQNINLPLTPFVHKKVTTVTKDVSMKKSKDELKSELKDIMVKELGIERHLIEDEGSLMNLGADSLTLLNIQSKTWQMSLCD